MRKAAPLCAVFFALLLAACATPDGDAPGPGRESTERWGARNGFRPARIAVAGIELYSLLRVRGGGDLLAVYIEGDGAPWLNSFAPPRDPTPHRALPLMLAAADPSPAAAYLGRPCQYLDAAALSRCPVGHWAERRFAPELLAAMNEAVSRLKATAGARHLRLVGYSGGGVVAALLAARRSDVSELVTVAAPLALSYWLSVHELSPLAEASDPARLDAAAKPVPAIHFAGAEDRVVPPRVVGRYVEARGGKLAVVAGFDHDCCWERDWQLRLQHALQQLRDAK